MAEVTLTFETASVALKARALVAVERLGEPSTFDFDLFSEEPVAPADVLRKGCSIVISSDVGGRAITGVVTRFVVVATDNTLQRVYRMTVRSQLAILELRRPSRIFQNLTVPQIVAAVVTGGGFGAVTTHVSGTYAPQPYVVQHNESDARFVRRLCEEAGLYFHFAAGSAEETFVLEDTSANADVRYPDGLSVSNDKNLAPHLPVALDLRRVRRAAVGKVTLRDYDLEHPMLKLEGTATNGATPEQDIELYEGPGGFKTVQDGQDRAKLRLESLRAEASLVSFDTNAAELEPGVATTLEPVANYRGTPVASGKIFVVGVTTRWSEEDGVASAHVEAISQDVPYRLARITPRARIAGIQTATVTGQTGHEVHPDEFGRVHLRFHWDVFGPGDHTSGIPMRVAQPHTPGSMILPRVGWEVFVMFEDGDPNRPYVLGRSFNSKQPPPQPLPANKTISSIATDSSPGAPARSTVQFDDAAGREHMLFNAPFGKLKEAATSLTTQTMKNENQELGGSATWTIGGNESISVSLAWMQTYGSQDLSVAAIQYQNAGGNFVSGVGSEKVLVLGLVGEQVGNPVKGAAQLAAATVLARVGAMGTAGAIIAAGAGVGKAAVEGYIQGGAAGAKSAAMMGAAGVAMSFVPGGEAIMSSITGSSKPMPWDHGQPPAGPVTPGGGGAAASGGGGGPSGPGPGYRATLASSSYTEVVVGKYGIATPGSVSWVTTGASAVVFIGNHTTSTKKGGMVVGGGLGEWLGSLDVDSKKDVAKKVLGLMKSTTSGTVDVKAGGAYNLTAKTSLTLKVTGTLQIGGSPVTFKCGGSEISASSSGVLIKSSSITFKGSNSQGGSLTHK